jgi:hypothetical protein
MAPPASAQKPCAGCRRVILDFTRTMMVKISNVIILLSPPARRKSCHCCFTCRSIPMRRRSVLMVPESECPHPRVSDRRGIRVEDAADHSALVSICHEEPTTATLGKGRQRTPTLSRLACYIHASRSAQVLDQRRASCGRDARTQRVEALI